ncbi:MAG TPA: sugar transferase [Candidatus Sulfotelmatobacter sp.]|nr:sugar transferase [Candidatus Sulfotelmatobacter sp.]
MSSHNLNPNPRSPQRRDWDARLIPGAAASLFRRNAKKPPARAGSGLQPLTAPSWASLREVASPENPLAVWLPQPFRKLWAGSWLNAMAADFALVGVNWLLVAAVFLQLHRVFAHAWLFEHPAGAAARQVLGIALLHATLITLLGYSEGLYTRSGGWRRQVTALGKAAAWATVILCVGIRLLGASSISSIEICAVGALHFAALLAWRRANQRKARLTSEAGQGSRNALIVGAGPVGRGIVAYVESHPESGRAVCGFLDDELPMGNGVIGRVSNLAQLARAGFVDEVILAAPDSRELILRVLREARRLRLDVTLVPDLIGCRSENSEADRVGDQPSICLHQECQPAVGLFVKRLVDAVGAGIGLVVLSPLLGLIAGMIKLDSKGGVLYAAPRAGYKGRPFRCYKFRTMVSNADELKLSLRRQNQKSGPCFKIAGDPRITRLGGILRRYSLDELPQLWNVLKGEMSLVGPRPHPLDDFAAYEIEDLARLDVMPGITGLWQVMARRDPSFQRGMDLDREYIGTWSLGQDLRIMFRTLLALIEGSGD